MPFFYLFSLIFTLLPFLVIGFIVLIIVQATSQSPKKVMGRGKPKPSSLLEKYQADWAKNAQKQKRSRGSGPRANQQSKDERPQKRTKKNKRQGTNQAKRRPEEPGKGQTDKRPPRQKQASVSQKPDRLSRSQAKSDSDWSGEINSKSGNRIYQREIQSIFDKEQDDHRQNLNQGQNLGQQVAKNLKRDQLKQAMIYKEILDKPKSLSDDL